MKTFFIVLSRPATSVRDRTEALTADSAPPPADMARIVEANLRGVVPGLVQP